MSRFLPPAWHPTAALTLLAGSLLATPALGATPLPSPAPKAPTVARRELLESATEAFRALNAVPRNL